MNFLLHNPTRLHFGKGKLENLKNEIKNGTKVLLTYGSGNIKKFGLYDEVVKILKELNCEVHELSGIEPNPKLSSVRKNRKCVRRMCKSNFLFCFFICYNAIWIHFCSCC